MSVFKTSMLITLQGNMAFKRKDFRSAVRYYSDAIRRDEGNAIVYSNRAAAYLAMRRYTIWP